MAQDTIVLEVKPREVTGKAVKRLRREGLVPAVIHDHGKDSLVVQADYNEMAKVFSRAGRHHTVSLKAGDKKFTTLIKSATFDPKKHRLSHVVFNAVKANEKVEAEIPIRPRYDEGNDSAPAERAGLLVLSQLDAVTVKAVPSQLPDVLEYDAEKLVEIGDSATVADLIVPAGVEIETDATHAVATVYEPSALQAANEAAGGEAEIEAPATESEQTEATDEAEAEATEEE